MLHLFSLLSFMFANFFAAVGPAEPPVQPALGPGGAEYVCDSVKFLDFAQEADGYWLFEPVAPKLDSAHLVVFVHGYGGYNPMIYGKWIKHLVRRGNIVVYPRYQLHMLSPSPDHFSENVSKAVRDALVELEKDGYVKPILSKLAFVGHSYGGVVSADLAINFAEHEIPQPKVMLLCAPGSGKFKGGRLDSYAEMPADLSLLIVAHEDDWVVGDEFAHKVYEEATSVKQRNLLFQSPDDHGEPIIQADHNQAYGVDTTFDTGVRNYTSKKALRVATVDAVDFNGYWKLFDAMLDCSRNGTHCEFAFGGTPEQVGLGEWSDGVAIRPFEARVPE